MKNTDQTHAPTPGSESVAPKDPATLEAERHLDWLLEGVPVRR